jgi:hypothetical protein
MTAMRRPNSCAYEGFDSRPGLRVAVRVTRRSTLRSGLLKAGLVMNLAGGSLHSRVTCRPRAQGSKAYSVKRGLLSILFLRVNLAPASARLVTGVSSETGSILASII